MREYGIWSEIRSRDHSLILMLRIICVMGIKRGLAVGKCRNFCTIFCTISPAHKIELFNPQDPLLCLVKT